MNKTLFNAVVLLALFFLPGHAQTYDYGLPADIQKGNILHCFSWNVNDIKAELPRIAEAGFGAIQISPMQHGDFTTSTVWYDVYRPYDFAFFGNSAQGSEQNLRDLCSEAAKYGIKIVMDVVFNHVDGWPSSKTSGHDAWWNSNDRLRWLGGPSDWDDRYQVTHLQLGGANGYPDVNSELTEVANRAVTYLQKLVNIGIKGIRFDAVKHVSLPSEDCNFWKTVCAVPGLYYYGEILGGPGGKNNDNLMKEYTNYMSVTDDSYGDNATSNSGVPSGHANWGARGISSDKLVLWGESHDTYCNTGGSSKNISQSKVDKGYAIVACRANEAALYFSRPLAESRASDDIKLGLKGSMAFTAKHIAEVNKFRNRMVGKSDYYSSSSNAASVTRGNSVADANGGAVIVAKNGYATVSVPNGNSYVKPGTYTDRVAGGTFTVTGSTITGNVGATGIAVIYGTYLDDVNPDQESAPELITIYYDNSTTKWNSVYCYSYDSNDLEYLGGWPGSAMTSVATNIYSIKVPKGSSVVFNNNGGTQTADVTSVTDKHLYKGSSTSNKCSVTDSGVYSGANTDPNPKPSDPSWTIYFDNSDSNWSNVYIYVFGNGKDNAVGNWPGTKMTLDSKTGFYIFTSDKDLSGTSVIFNNNSDAQTGNGVSLVNNGIYHYSSSAENVFKKIYQTGDKPESAPDETITIYYDNSATEWNSVYCYAFVGSDKPLGNWPGTKMTAVSGETNIYSIEVVPSATVIFNGGNGQPQTVDISPIADNHVYQGLNTKDGNNHKYSDLGVYSGKQPEPDPDPEPAKDITIYYDNSVTNWAKVCCYGYDSTGATLGDWPGQAMTLVSGRKYIYTITLTEGSSVVFSNNGDAQTLDVASVEDGHIYKGLADTDANSNGKQCNKTSDEGLYSDSYQEEEPAPVVYITVYYDNHYTGWNSVRCYSYVGTVGNGESWPGGVMTKVAGKTDIWEASVPEGSSLVFNGGQDQPQTVDVFAAEDGHVYLGLTDKNEEDRHLVDDRGDISSYEEITVVPTPTDGDYYVYFDNLRNSEWATVYVWAWNEETKEDCCANTSWPGDKMIDKDGKLFWSSDKEPTNIIFSINGGTKKAAGESNPEFIIGATYYPSGENDADMGLIYIYFNNNEVKWNRVFCHNFNGCGSASEWPGQEMQELSTDPGILYVKVPYDCSVVFCDETHAPNEASYAMTAKTAVQSDATPHQSVDIHNVKPYFVYTLDINDVDEADANTPKLKLGSAEKMSQTPTAIESPEADTNSPDVTVADGMLILSGFNGTHLTVSTMDGRIIFTGTVTDRVSLSLEPGAYVVSNAGTGVKVLVK